MAQRFKAEQLKEMIRALVREELTGAVKSAINEILSERYLKQLAEVAASRPRGVGRTMHIADGDDQEDEGIPEVLRNDSDGIYNRHPMKKSDSLEDDEPEQLAPVTFVPEGKNRDEMLSLFFEGTRPINEIDAEVGIVEGDEDVGVPIQGMPGIPQGRPSQKRAAGKRRPLNEVWTELAGLKDGAKPQAPAPGQPMRVDPEVEQARIKMEEARLKRVRESLEHK